MPFPSSLEETKSKLFQSEFELGGPIPFLAPIIFLQSAHTDN